MIKVATPRFHNGTKVTACLGVGILGTSVTMASFHSSGCMPDSFILLNRWVNSLVRIFMTLVMNSVLKLTISDVLFNVDLF